MAVSEDLRRLPSAARRLRSRVGGDWLTLAVVAVSVASLAARCFRLGARTAHFDEGRVAYWTVEYAATGAFRYRPMIHGPFLHHVNEVVFGVLGPTDFAMRSVVALLTGLFPLTALLLRDRLRDSEVLGLAGFWAFTPVVLYYSRFMRGDPLVAVFMVSAFALFVRTLDTGRRRYFYAGVGATALGFTVKENALLYLLCWAGAVVLLLDHRLFRAADRGGNPRTTAHAYGRRALATVWNNLDALFVGALLFLAVVVFFYAPRGQTAVGPGLGTAIGDPSLLPGVVREATLGSAEALWDTWVGGEHQRHPYVPYLAHFLSTLRHGALAVCGLSVVGFLADRYRPDGPSDLVAVAFYWGAVSVLGYPLATDIKAPWATLHAVVPLAIPAAVGLGLFVRWGRTALADDDAVDAALAGCVVALVLIQMAVAGVGAVYQSPAAGENELLQYAQPADGVQSTLRPLDAAAPAHEGTDVVVYGEYFVTGPNASGVRRPACSPWQQVLPLPWYFERADADLACAQSAEELRRTVESDRPLLVVARPFDRSRFGGPLSSYAVRRHQLRAWDTEVTFLVREDLANESSETLPRRRPAR